MEDDVDKKVATVDKESGSNAYNCKKTSDDLRGVLKHEEEETSMDHHEGRLDQDRATGSVSMGEVEQQMTDLEIARRLQEDLLKEEKEAADRDLELARKLQEEFLKVEKEVLERDLEFAKKYNELNQNTQQDPEALEKDLKLARKLNEENVSANEEAVKQDLELARKLEEEENENKKAKSSLEHLEKDVELAKMLSEEDKILKFSPEELERDLELARKLDVENDHLKPSPEDLEKDLEFARKLEEENRISKPSQEELERDLELARKLDEENEQLQSSPELIEKDLEFAKKLEEEENENRGPSPEELERDLEIAKELEEENKKFKPDPEVLKKDLEIAKQLHKEEEREEREVLESDFELAKKINEEAKKPDSQQEDEDFDSSSTLDDDDSTLNHKNLKLDLDLSSSELQSEDSDSDSDLSIESEIQSVESESAEEDTKTFCHSCDLPASYYIEANGNKYHPKCFKCAACFEVIKADEPVSYSEEDGHMNPFHTKCYTQIFGIFCTICQEAMPSTDDGTVSYCKHPFFSSEHFCPKHTEENLRHCTSCFRFEPQNQGFVELGDAGRCICQACCRTVIVDSEDAKPLWKKVIRYLEDKCKLPIWPGMKEVPVLVVASSALNEQLTDTVDNGLSQTFTRGVCLSEQQRGNRFQTPAMRFNRENGSFTPNDEDSKGHVDYEVPGALTKHPESSVNAILCISGLPADLTASVLAHEATHAWIKLNTNFTSRRPIPMKVEEGCCQLMAMLFLKYGLDEASTESKDNEPSDQMLRDFFMFGIESDKSEVYGDGYRMAKKLYDKMGIKTLLSHVAMYQEFPSLE